MEDLKPESEVKPCQIKFMDEDESSDEEEEYVPSQIKAYVAPKIKPIIGDRELTSYIFPNAKKYAYKSWHECFPSKKVNLRELVFNPAWNEFFNQIEKKSYFKQIERILSDYLMKSKETILPHAELVFNIFNLLSPKNINVVIIGQDPYPGSEMVDGKIVYHATGSSFSLPVHIQKTKSLDNIYQNLHTYHHIRKIPTSGCLAPWILQGCFLLNATLTTFHTQRNGHRNVWKNFTTDLLSYINKNCENVVFLVWGKDAQLVCKNIDPVKHHIITSSHPSPLGFDKTVGGYAYGNFKNESDRPRVTYPPFNTVDHFGKANEYLLSNKKREILWDLID